MSKIPRTLTIDNSQIIFTPILWTEYSEITPCDGLKLPDRLHTRGKVADRLGVDPALVFAYQRAAILVITVIHLDAPRRQPFTGYLHLLDLLKHGSLHYDQDGAPQLIFPKEIIRYPAKKSKTATRRCNARRPKGA